MFSSSTMESSTRRPTPSARPPRVKTLSVCPEAAVEQHEGGHDGERDGHAHDRRRPHAQQKEQDHQHRERAALEGLVLQRGDGRPDVARLVEADLHPHPGGPRGAARGSRAGVDHGDGVGPGLLHHAEVDAAAAVDAHDVAWSATPSTTRGDVAHAHGRRAGVGGLRDDEPAELPRGGRPGCWRRRCSPGRPRGASRSGGGGCPPARRRPRRGPEAARPQRVAVHAYTDLADAPAADGGAGHAREPLDLRLDDVVGEVVELPLVEPVGAHRELRHGDVGDVELEDEGLLHPRRQRVEDLRDPLRHLELRVVEVGPVGEPHAHHRDALLRGALDAVDARGRGHRALDGHGDGDARCRGPAPA
jgi:hypothetical protein